MHRIPSDVLQQMYPQLAIPLVPIGAQKLFALIRSRLLRKAQKGRASAGKPQPQRSIRLEWKGEMKATIHLMQQTVKGMRSGPSAFVKSVVMQHNRRTMHSNHRATAPLWLSFPTQM